VEKSPETEVEVEKSPETEVEVEKSPETEVEVEMETRQDCDSCTRKELFCEWRVVSG
jgi:hypothetical protein